MICPKCGCHDRVMRTVTIDGTVQRERRCPMCAHRVYTEEKPVEPPKPKRKKKTAPKTEVSKAVEVETPKGALDWAMATAKD